MKKNFSLGFTLLEILVVMGILTIVAGFGLALSLDDYRDYLFRDERDTVIGALQKARSQAINNICLGSGCSDGVPHGVLLQNSQYTVFQGTSYASRNTSVDQILPSNYGSMSITGTTQVVFSQLSGDASPAGTIILTDNTGHSSVITINSEGQISWTN